MNRDEVWQQLKDDKSLVYGEPILDVFLKILGNAGTDPLFGGEMLSSSIDKAHYLELPIEKRRLISPSNRAYFYSDDLDDLKDAVRLGASTNSLNNRLQSEIFKDRFPFIEYLMNNGADDFASIISYAAKKGDIELFEELIEKIENQIDSQKISKNYGNNFRTLPKEHAIEVMLDSLLQGAIKNIAEDLASKRVKIERALKQFDFIKFLIEQKRIKIPKWIIELAESVRRYVYINENESAKTTYENLMQYLESKYKEQNE